MNYFKVDDEVRVLEKATSGNVKVGTIDVITFVGDDGAVKVGNRMFNWFLGENGGKLELVKTEPIYPNPPHIHQKEINAWAAGAQIEGNHVGEDWYVINVTPKWFPSVKYRVKPDVPTVDPRLELLNEKLAELNKAVAYVKKEIGEL